MGLHRVAWWGASLVPQQAAKLCLLQPSRTSEAQRLASRPHAAISGNKCSMKSAQAFGRVIIHVFQCNAAKISLVQIPPKIPTGTPKAQAAACFAKLGEGNATLAGKVKTLTNQYNIMAGNVNPKQLS